MLNRDQALVISEAIDDQRQLPSGADAAMHDEIARQRRVDTLLRASAPGMARPSPAGLSDRIIAAVGQTQPDHLVLRRVGFAPLFAAAAAVLVVVTATLMLRSSTPSGPKIHGAPLGALRLPTDLSEPISLTIESPYKSEALRLQEDTKRAADAVLAYLPLSR